MQAHLIIFETIMAILSRNNASHEVDAAPRVVDGNDRDHNDRLFVWLDAQMALSLNFMDPQESQGSNNVPPDVTPKESIINHLESHGSNDIPSNSDHNMVQLHTTVKFWFPFHFSEVVIQQLTQ